MYMDSPRYKVVWYFSRNEQLVSWVVIFMNRMLLSEIVPPSVM